MFKDIFLCANFDWTTWYVLTETPLQTILNRKIKVFIRNQLAKNFCSFFLEIHNSKFFYTENKAF